MSAILEAPAAVNRWGTGSESSHIMLIGEYWGEEEAKACEPFVGSSGRELNRMLQEAGIMRTECWATNVINQQPPYGDPNNWIAKEKKHVTYEHKQYRGLWVKQPVIDGVESLRREIDFIKPRLIIALGNLALWALTPHLGIQKWRGSQLQMEGTNIPLVPTYNPAAVLRQWEWRVDVVQDFRRASSELVKPSKRPQWKFRVRPTYEEAIHTLGYLLDRLNHDEGFDPWFDFDIETRAGHIDCVGISWSAEDALIIPLMCNENPAGYWSLEEEAVVVHTLQHVLCHPRAKVRWQNGLYDAQYTYKHWGWVPRGVQDTMLAQHVLWAGRPKSLAYQASIYCEQYVYWKDDGKVYDPKTPQEKRWRYNGEDCVRTREVGEVEAHLIRHQGLESQDAFMQKMFWPVLAAMQRGVRIDKATRTRFGDSLLGEMTKREQQFKDLLGHTLNPGSHPQMHNLFYQDFAQPTIRARGMKGLPGRPTLNDAALETIAAREPLLQPLIKAIQEYRTLGIFLRNFVLAKLDEDQRMRCGYNICGTETYRLASNKSAFDTGTNLQNVPKGGDDDDSGLELPNIRSMFIPDPGFTFFDTDLSKADLRIVVWEADEREMKSMLGEGRDPYVETAREFYKDPTITKTRADGSEHPKYRVFKSFSHGTHYLGTPRGLAQRLGLTVHVAEKTQAWYFGKYPAIKKWQIRLKEEITRTHQVTNCWGFRRHYFDRIDEDVFREAIAWIPQSSIALLINKIWLRIHEEEKRIQVLLQVHDSLAGQFPSHLGTTMVERMKELAHIPLPYEDPLTIPVGIKISEKSWGDCS